MAKPSNKASGGKLPSSGAKGSNSKAFGNANDTGGMKKGSMKKGGSKKMK